MANTPAPNQAEPCGDRGELANKPDSTGDSDGVQDAAVERLVLVRVGSSDRQALLVKKNLKFLRAARLYVRSINRARWMTHREMRMWSGWPNGARGMPRPSRRWCAAGSSRWPDSWRPWLAETTWFRTCAKKSSCACSWRDLDIVKPGRFH